MSLFKQKKQEHVIKLLSELMNVDKSDQNNEYHEVLYRLSESENPKYTKYKDQYLTCTNGSFCKDVLDDKDKTMIMNILINETKYSHHLEKLIEVKKQINKYYKEYKVLKEMTGIEDNSPPDWNQEIFGFHWDLSEKVFEFWDFDESDELLEVV
jgi:hypothetical protein